MLAHSSTQEKSNQKQPSSLPNKSSKSHHPQTPTKFYHTSPSKHKQNSSPTIIVDFQGNQIYLYEYE
jgi:hypothetical protein